MAVFNTAKEQSTLEPLKAFTRDSPTDTDSIDPIVEMLVEHCSLIGDLDESLSHPGGEYDQTGFPLSASFNSARDLWRYLGEFNAGPSRSTLSLQLETTVQRMIRVGGLTIHYFYQLRSTLRDTYIRSSKMKALVTNVAIREYEKDAKESAASIERDLREGMRLERGRRSWRRRLRECCRRSGIWRKGCEIWRTGRGRRGWWWHSGRYTRSDCLGGSRLS